MHNKKFPILGKFTLTALEEDLLEASNYYFWNCPLEAKLIWKVPLLWYQTYSLEEYKALTGVGILGTLEERFHGDKVICLVATDDYIYKNNSWLSELASITIIFSKNNEYISSYDTHLTHLNIISKNHPIKEIAKDGIRTQSKNHEMDTLFRLGVTPDEVRKIAELIPKTILNNTLRAKRV